MSSLKLFVIALVAAFFALGEADFETLQQQVEDELAMSRSRLSNFELFLKEEHNAKVLYQQVKNKCDHVKHQFDLLVVEIVKLRGKEDLNAKGFRARVNPIIPNLSNEFKNIANLIAKYEIKDMLQDKVTHAIIMSRLKHGVDKYEDFVVKLGKFEEFAQTP
ncbi:hypothetical protein Ddc_10566 [Ditylenchus destructor]|nr:hypothetical protein Ddc_10566 [Ditylenchus destructor]